MKTPVSVDIKVLNLKTDRRVRIHWFMRTDDGPIQTGSMVASTALGPMVLGGSRGKIVCQPKRTTLTSPMVLGRYQPCPCSDDVRAVTCDLCAATPEYKRAVEELAEILGNLEAKQRPKEVT